jgi:gluconolactonase
MHVVARGLRFPEGPVSLADGSVLLVEIESGYLTRVAASGQTSRLAHCGGGPNGAAIGPDDHLYVCNNGGFTWTQRGPFLAATGRAEDYAGGRIQRVNPRTGVVESLYSACDGDPLNAPNDIVFDAEGGFYFTDTGTTHSGKSDVGAVYYALPGGDRITRVVTGMDKPNGIGLSPDGTRLYVAESRTARIWYWDVDAPGRLTPGSTAFAPGGGTPFYVFDHFVLLDSLAVDSEGAVCVGTVAKGGISRITATGVLDDFLPVPMHDPVVSNICFDVTDPRTAYVTSSGLGLLYKTRWVCDGARLAFETLSL